MRNIDLRWSEKRGSTKDHPRKKNSLNQFFVYKAGVVTYFFPDLKCPVFSSQCYY